MISVQEARGIVMANVIVPEPDEVSLSDALNAFAAADIRAPYDHPLFDVSAVDGYAFAFDDATTSWTVVGSLAAGDVFHGSLSSGECVRIFTGAAVPSTADTVVMQEYVSREGNTVEHADQKLKRGSNVRLRAEHVKADDVVVDMGERITPAVLGLLASVGVRSVPIRLAPEVAVLITGNEFLSGDHLVPGRIFGSNGIMLEGALRMARSHAEVEHVQDDLKALSEAIAQAARLNDVVITTGGASVGDHDLVCEAVLRAGGTIHFHGVAQKPGKPMLFATVHGRPFFGLPGNPRAVMVLFWEYVLPYLRTMQGAREPGLQTAMLPLAEAISVKGERAEFRAAAVTDGRVKLLADEGSHMLRTLAEADVIAYLPAERRSWQAGDPIEVHHIPGD